MDAYLNGAKKKKVDSDFCEKKLILERFLKNKAASIGLFHHIWSNLQNAVQGCTRSSCLQSSYPKIVRYCECFAGGIYCDGCKCANCYNDVENENVRIAAIEGILERNPSAFKPKIASSPLKTPDSRVCK